MILNGNGQKAVGSLHQKQKKQQLNEFR